MSFFECVRKSHIIFLLFLLMPSSALCRANVRFQSYWRVRTDTRAYISWNEEALGVTYSSSTGNLSFVGDGEFSFLGKGKAQFMEELSYLERIDPFRLRLNDLFVLIENFPYEGAYLRVGRQIRKWGTADVFNPSDLLNPYSFEDPIMFGESLGNEMILLNLPVHEMFSIELVCIPLFRPAQLPESAIFALSENSPQIPEPLKKAQEELREKGDPSFLVNLLDLDGYTMERSEALVNFPSRKVKNVQYAVKISTSIKGVDLSFFYFRGFEDIPYPGNIRTDIVQSKNWLIISPHAEILYPKIQALGADFTTSLEFLDGAGLWFEGAVFFPESYTSTISFSVSLTDPSKEALISFFLPSRKIELLKDFYWKFTAGMDYTFPGGFYINIQFLHGFIDEIGRDLTKYYLFFVLEKSLFKDRVKFRFSTGLNLNDKSYVLLPEIYILIQRALEIHGGTYLLQGGKYTKFGQPAAGGDEAFLSIMYKF